MRAEDAACIACGAPLRAVRAPTGAFSSVDELPPALRQDRPAPAATTPRFDGSAAVALASPPAPAPVPMPGGEDPEGSGARPSRPPPPPPALLTETGSFPTQARLTPAAQNVVRPPVLASEALRRDLAPATPGAGFARSVALATGLAGMVLTAIVAGPHGFGLPVGGALLVVALLGVVPLPYAARASALAAVAGSGLAVVSWHAFTVGVLGIEGLILRIGVLVLGMALLFRAWHRASLLARALVALGIALCAGWLWMSQTFAALLVLEAAAQSWLGPVLSVALALLLMLSTLAFMDSRTTGGCVVWAGLTFGWSTAHGGVELLRRIWQPGAAVPSLAELTADLWVALATAPLFGIALAVALAQLLAVTTAAEAA